MDYGRAAYLKTEDLERRLDAAVSTPKIRNAYTILSPRFRLNGSGGFDAAAIRGDGSMALIVKLTLDAESGGVLELYVDGARAGRAEVQKGKSVEIMMNNVTVMDGGSLRLAAADGFDGVVESVEITLIGANAEFDAAVFDWAADSSGDVSVLLTNEDGRLIMRLNETGGVPDAGTEAVFAAKAIRADTAVIDGVCYIVYSDANSNLWGCTAQNGSVSEKVRLGGGADSVAVSPYGDGLLIAAVYKGVIKYFTTDFSFKLKTLPADLDSSVRASSVLFIKNSSAPALVYFNGSKSYLKTLEKETAAGANISVTVEISVTQSA